MKIKDKPVSRGDVAKLGRETFRNFTLCRGQKREGSRCTTASNTINFLELQLAFVHSLRCPDGGQLERSGNIFPWISTIFATRVNVVRIRNDTRSNETKARCTGEKRSPIVPLRIYGSVVQSAWLLYESRSETPLLGRFISQKKISNSTKRFPLSALANEKWN